MEVFRASSPFEAEIFVAALRSRGITATAVQSTRRNWQPVMVFASDLETAKAILAERA